MKKALLIFLCVTLTAAVLSSQDYKGKARVSGVVLDQDQKPIEGAKLKFFLPKANGGFEIMTDKEGKWTAAWIAGGDWNLDIEKLGYEPKKLAVNLAEQRKNPEMKINLKKVEGLILTGELEDMLIKANQLFDQENYQGALEGYQAILAKFPEAFLIQRNVGNAYFAMEKYDLAEETYKKILDKEPADVEATLVIGNCYANRGQNDKALEWYNKIQFDKIKDATVLYNIGTNYYNLSKFEDALKYYKRSVELQKDDLSGIYQLGLTYTSLQKTAEAIAMFEQYMRLDPDSPRSSQVKGFLDYLKKK